MSRQAEGVTLGDLEAGDILLKGRARVKVGRVQKTKTGIIRKTVWLSPLSKEVDTWPNIVGGLLHVGALRECDDGAAFTSIEGGELEPGDCFWRSHQLRVVEEIDRRFLYHRPFHGDDTRAWKRSYVEAAQVWKLVDDPSDFTCRQCRDDSTPEG